VFPDATLQSFDAGVFFNDGEGVVGEHEEKEVVETDLLVHIPVQAAEHLIPAFLAELNPHLQQQAFKMLFAIVYMKRM
jgi:hypothetical protein